MLLCQGAKVGTTCLLFLLVYNENTHCVEWEVQGLVSLVSQEHLSAMDAIRSNRAIHSNAIHMYDTRNQPKIEETADPIPVCFQVA